MTINVPTPRPLPCASGLPPSCLIRGHRLYHNGHLRYAHPTPTDSLDIFLTAAYRNLGLQYPKFFKMDPLCKLAFLTAELLLAPPDQVPAPPAAGLGIVLSNRSSSQLTDLTYQRSIATAEAYFPSPAVFVYTLPNIMIGELSIRHQLTGEHSLFITEDFEPTLLELYATQLLATGLSQHCLCGWVEVNTTHYEAFFYLLDAASPTAAPHFLAGVQQLYAA